MPQAHKMKDIKDFYIKSKKILIEIFLI